MATDPDKKSDAPPSATLREEGRAAAREGAEPGKSLEAPMDLAEKGALANEDDDVYAGAAEDVMPTYKRFVYAAYFAAAILVAFVADRTFHFAWLRLAQWRPEFGEPRDEFIMPLSGVAGALAAVYYWRNVRTRELAESVAQELSKVTWPTKNEVMNNTVVVIVTTAFATVFFALMDRFWGFVTNLVYGT